MGMGAGRIPWHEAYRWAFIHEYDEDETETLIDLVERLDLEELKLIYEKAGEPASGKKSTPSSRD